MKTYKISYLILYTGDAEPTYREIEFKFRDTVMDFYNTLDKHTNLISFKVERINHGK